MTPEERQWVREGVLMAWACSFMLSLALTAALVSANSRIDRLEKAIAIETASAAKTGNTGLARKGESAGRKHRP
jgi:hypothetical protein